MSAPELSATQNESSAPATWQARIEAWQYVLLVTICAVGGALRFYKLGAFSFWRDEMYTIRDSAGVMVRQITDMPLSLVLTHLSIDQFGNSEWGARLAATVIGIATIFLLYFPIRRLLNVRIALLAMLLLAIVPWHIYWSQNARFYTSLLLFFNLGLFCFHIGMEEDKPLYLIASLVFLGAAVMERLVALTFVPIVTLYWILLFVLPYERPAGWRWRTFLIYIVPGLIVGIPFMWPFVNNLSDALSNFGFINNNPIWILAGVVFYVTVPIFLLGLAGMWIAFGERSRTGLLLTLGALLPLLMVMAVSLFQYSANRYVFIALPSWLVLASMAALHLLNGSSKASRIVALSVLAIMIMVPMVDNVMYYRFNSGNRPNWKAAYAYIERNWETGDIVAVPEPLLGEYYLPGKTVDVVTLDLDALAEGDQRVWFVEDLNLEYQRNQVYEWLRSKSIEAAVFDVQVQARNFKMRVHEYLPPVLTEP
jgi:hypothetical protein